jgi:dUTP pyrophosphatase
MTVKFKRLSEKAVLPTRAHKGDAGIDLTCTNIDPVLNEAKQIVYVYHTDLAVEIPEGYVGLLFPRSSIYKKSLRQSNCVGVIDSGYRGEVIVTFNPTTDVVPAIYQPGERFAQLVIVPYLDYDIEEAEELSETDRGERGLGSTGTTNENSADTGSQGLPETKDESTNPETANSPAAVGETEQA